MAWISAHSAFVVETSLKTGESVIAMQKTFGVHFMLHWNDVILDKKINIAMG